LTPVPPSPGTPSPAVAICVPVRNEEARLPRLFDALDRLIPVHGMPVHVCLLLDGCTDRSATLAGRYRDAARHAIHVAHVAPAPSNAGIARDRAMRLGIAAIGRSGGILLSTDADSWPRPDWIVAMHRALGQADIVAGHVARSGRRVSEGQDRLDRYYDGLFALRRRVDPVSWEAPATHHHASGANMGMRTETYVALGGFAPLAHGEDARLVDDAARAGWRVRRDAASVVQTSDRRHGRAQHGLADALKDLDRRGATAATVAHPADQLWQYRGHALARGSFGSGRFGALGDAIGLRDDHLQGVARDCPNAEAFAMRVVPVPPGGMRDVPFPVAETTLAALRGDAPTERAA
jgi:hypothetical protein